MPPGINDTTLDIIRLIKNIEFCIVTTPSKITTEVVKKLIELLVRIKYPDSWYIREYDQPREIRSTKKIFKNCYLGSIPFDETYEDSIGCIDKLLETSLAKTLRNFTVLGDIIC